MHDWWTKTFGNWSDQEIYEMSRANHFDFVNEVAGSLDDDPETWNEADFLSASGWSDYSDSDLDDFAASFD